MTYRIDCLYYSEKYPTGDYDNFLDMYKLVNDCTSVLAGPLLFVHASILEEEYGEKLSDEELQWIR